MADVVRPTGPEEDPQDRDGNEQDPGGGKGRGRRPGRFRRSRGKEKKGSFWRELPILIVTALVLTFLIQAFVARVYVIPSQSMEQTLHGCTGCTNDRILVDKVTYRFSEPEPGDVVVFRGPGSWVQNEFEVPESGNPVAQFFRNAASALGFGAPNEKDFVKRVIATEGQTVACCDARNRVTVNGEPLDEPYIHWEPGDPSEQAEFGPVTVPENHLWVMGDNRNDSADSRYQGGGGVAGAIPMENVIGKAQLIVLPPTRWQGIPEPNPQALSLGAPAWPTGLPAVSGLLVAFPASRTGRRLQARAVGRRSRDRGTPEPR